jgi:PAB1-binding protein PBP1
MADEKFIREQIRRILIEKAKSEDSSKKAGISKAKPGRGRVKGEISAAAALANKDPQKLMKKLKIESADGDTTAKKVASILKRAVKTLKSTEGLQTAYDSVEVVNTEKENYINIIPKELSPRDAMLYMNHTLVGAVNAGILTGLDKVVDLVREGDKVVVKFSDV